MVFHSFKIAKRGLSNITWTIEKKILTLCKLSETLNAEA